jgi:hypothetical protein
MKAFELKGSKVEDFSPETRERKETGCCTYNPDPEPH